MRPLARAPLPTDRVFLARAGLRRPGPSVAIRRSPRMASKTTYESVNAACDGREYWRKRYGCQQRKRRKAPVSGNFQRARLPYRYDWDQARRYISPPPFLLCKTLHTDVRGMPNILTGAEGREVRSHDLQEIGEVSAGTRHARRPGHGRDRRRDDRLGTPPTSPRVTPWRA